MLTLKGVYLLLRTKKIIDRQFDNINFDLILKQLADNVVNDPRVICIINDALEELVYWKKVRKYWYCSMKLTPKYIYSMLCDDPMPDIAYAFDDFSEDFATLVRTKFPETKQLPKIALKDLHQQLFALVMKRLVKKINDTGYHAKYHWLFDYSITIKY